MLEGMRLLSPIPDWGMLFRLDCTLCGVEVSTERKENDACQDHASPTVSRSEDVPVDPVHVLVAVGMRPIGYILKARALSPGLTLLRCLWKHSSPSIGMLAAAS